MSSGHVDIIWSICYRFRHKNRDLQVAEAGT